MFAHKVGEHAMPPFTIRDAMPPFTIRDAMPPFTIRDACLVGLLACMQGYGPVVSSFACGGSGRTAGFHAPIADFFAKLAPLGDPVITSEKQMQEAQQQQGQESVQASASVRQIEQGSNTKGERTAAAGLMNLRPPTAKLQQRLLQRLLRGRLDAQKLGEGVSKKRPLLAKRKEHSSNAVDRAGGVSMIAQSVPSGQVILPVLDASMPGVPVPPTLSGPPPATPMPSAPVPPPAPAAFSVPAPATPSGPPPTTPMPGLPVPPPATPSGLPPATMTMTTSEIPAGFIEETALPFDSASDIYASLTMPTDEDLAPDSDLLAWLEQTGGLVASPSPSPPFSPPSPVIS